MRLRNCAYVITFHIKKRQKNIKNLLLEEIYYNQGIDSIFEFIKKNLLIPYISAIFFIVKTHIF